MKKQSIHAYDKNGHEIPDGLGICGGHADLCSECAKFEYRDLWAWTVNQVDPVPGEQISEYWRRIGGRFLDAWYICAARKFREACVKPT